MDNKYKYCAYPFLNENGWITDYELQTDGLSSELGHAYSFLNKDDVKHREDITKLTRITLDLNPLVRKPNEDILNQCLKELEELYAKYFQDFDNFYLPLGNSFSTAISCSRKTLKIIIRILISHKHDNQKLLDSLNLFCNLLHLIWMEASDEKILFESKSYKLRK